MTFADIRKWIAGIIYPPYRRIADYGVRQAKENRELESIIKTLRSNNAILRRRERRRNAGK